MTWEQAKTMDPIALYRAERAERAAARDLSVLTGADLIAAPAPEYYRLAPIVVHAPGDYVPRADGRRTPLLAGGGAYRIAPRNGEA